MKIAILGAGNTGKAYSAYLSDLGHSVILYDRDPQRLTPIANHGIQATGAVNGTFFVPVTNQLQQAADSDLILVCTTASGHRPLAAALSGQLRPGQIILVTNGCWGAVEFDLELGKEADEKHCTICETGGQLILCHSPAPHQVYLKTIKQTMALSCVHPGDTAAALTRLQGIFPQLYAASSVLDTSLNNANPVIHGSFLLFNATRLENGEDYLLFGTGVTPQVAHVMEQVDAERVAVVRACGVPAHSELELLNSFWSQPQNSLYDVLHNTPSYQVTRGPKTLSHRYFTEDLPYGLVPYLKLGRKLGVDTPVLSSLLYLLGVYMQENYAEQGPDLVNLPLSRYLLQESSS